MHRYDNQDLGALREKKGFICDMDGVVYHSNELIGNVRKFLSWLQREDKKFLFLTNSSEKSPKELQEKLRRLGVDVDENHFYTSALATAKFLSGQQPGCSVYCIGEAGLHNALYQAGIIMNDVCPDYVVVGETQSYNYQSIAKATHLVLGGAKLIATNSDLTGPGAGGAIFPACRALVAPIELASGRQAYYMGKPNPLMMRTGLKMLGCHSADAVMVGDRMDTDMISGIEAGLDTVLVLTGVSSLKTLDDHAYRPKYILGEVGDIAP